MSEETITDLDKEIDEMLAPLLKAEEDEKVAAKLDELDDLLDF